ncbi:MAG: GGDEF domain-containing protein [Planctomycetota bacterium]
MPGARPEQPDDPRPQPAPPPVVLVCDHGRAGLHELVDALSRSGMDVRESTSLAETRRLLDDLRPDVVALNPLMLVTGGVELELMEALQRDDDPVPVLLLLDDLQPLADAPRWRLPIRDFLRKPAAAGESLHRIEVLLLHRRRYRTLSQHKQRLEGQISVDFKTGLFSEQHFWRLLGLEWKRARRHQNPLSLMFVDVDDFKSVNDSTEYTFGDEVLKKVGETLRATVRETDFAARCGGDEFCLLLPQTTPKEAVQTALRIRQRVAETVVQRGGYSRQVTVSIGIDAHDARTPGSVELLRSRANLALKEAKKRGKNQVWLYSGEAIGPAPASEQG